MAEEKNQTNNYGYESDEVKVSPFNFGLNAGNAFLTKFEWTPTGGADGAEVEALDIIFTINGTAKNYRLFPITKAFIKGGGETTDPNSKEFKDAIKDFNAKVFHIVHCFVDNETYQAALSRPIASFREFCTLVQSLLPKGYETKPLDIFLQYQWQPSEGQTRTYLDLPKKMSYGKWVVAAQPGNWNKVQVTDPSDDIREALYYKNEKDEKHPFIRNGWFMRSNFARQQSDDSSNSESGGTVDSTSNDASAAQQNAATSATTQSW